MDASAYARLAFRWWWLLILAIVLGAVVARGVSQLIPPTYSASTTLLVMYQKDPAVLQREDLETSALLAQTFVTLITTEPLLQETISRGGFDISVDDLSERVSVTHTRASQILEITATARSAGRARDIAGTLATVFLESEQVATRAGIVGVVEPAVAPELPDSPKHMVNAILGALLGLVACSVSLLVRDAGAESLTPRAAIEAARLAVIGELRDFGRADVAPDRLPAAFYPRSDAAEEYRLLRANLSAVLGHDASGALQRKVVLLTSLVAGNIRSSAAANLAVTFGAAGLRVLLVDADLRVPSLHSLFSLGNGPGLANYLVGEGPLMVRHLEMTHSGTAGAPRRSAAVAAVLGAGDDSGSPSPSKYSTLSFLSAGSPTMNPADLLGSATMRAALSSLRDRYDVILLDGPPLAGRADTSALAALADAIVVIARSGKARPHDLAQLAGQFPGPQPILAGLVLEGVTRRRSSGRRDPAADEMSQVLWSVQGPPEA